MNVEQPDNFIFQFLYAGKYLHAHGGERVRVLGPGGMVSLRDWHPFPFKLYQINLLRKPPLDI